jgi:hypothetical protein
MMTTTLGFNAGFDGAKYEEGAISHIETFHIRPWRMVCTYRAAKPSDDIRMVYFP